MVLVLLLAWPAGLTLWANSRIRSVDALSNAAGTPGTTYLLAGSDARPVGQADGTTGGRSDTILLLHVPVSGPTALISLPRDSYVKIRGHGSNKLNAAYSWGGPKLLVQTVEQLTGMTIDHYVGVEFDGVAEIVDAFGGVDLCSSLNVSDEVSGLVWTPGCHPVKGQEAMLFARMRYADPQGDIGRTLRQRELLRSLAASAADPSLLLRPGRQVSLVRAGTDALTVDKSAGIIDLARLALDLRRANGPGGITGTPPIKNLNYRAPGVGSAVQLDPALTPTFFRQVRDGQLPPGPTGGMPG